MRQKYLRILLAVAMVATGVLGAAAAPAAAAPAAGANLAAGRSVSASGSHREYPAANVNDGDRSTYWESTGDAFPNGSRSTWAPRSTPTRSS
ncbi:hypothetical protein ACFQHO_51540 [Actinomadura yumaensis]|uniref:hypothetical protein n=1 Tax=Actinomadura yumaensis TaxID=111807 RepID=UPI00361FB0D3